MLVLGFVREKSVAQDKLYNFVDLTIRLPIPME